MTTGKKSSRRNRSRINKPQGSGDMIVFAVREKKPLFPPISLPHPHSTKEHVINLVKKLISKPKVTKFPNSFIIYRNAYVKYLKDNGHSIPMIKLSQMLSNSWKMEPLHTKDIYTKISNEAEKLYDQIIKMDYSPQDQPSLDELHLSLTEEFDNWLAYLPSAQTPYWSSHPLHDYYSQVESTNVLPNQPIHSSYNTPISPIFFTDTDFVSNITLDSFYSMFYSNNEFLNCSWDIL
ncbi:901_t:CDS:1 [Acaulospora morrowiae]|uniref:901_t:CDS:1 n=1 Tax=Acaulospora morrowiae TaxID=94023 RepID=A0A9N8ZTW2_9GLOM|nr:901_t:CDS:1 [Acaulospora morrowiae]